MQPFITTHVSPFKTYNFPESIKNFKNYREQSLSWKDIQQIPFILWKKRVYYDVLGKPPLSYSLIQMKPIHALPSISLTSNLILFFHLCLGLSSGLFLSGFSSKTRVQLRSTLYGSHAPSISYVVHFHPGTVKVTEP
jgi:hypothetical protein